MDLRVPHFAMQHAISAAISAPEAACVPPSLPLLTSAGPRVVSFQFLVCTHIWEGCCLKRLSGRAPLCGFSTLLRRMLIGELGVFLGFNGLELISDCLYSPLNLT